VPQPYKKPVGRDGESRNCRRWPSRRVPAPPGEFMAAPDERGARPIRRRMRGRGIADPDPSSRTEILLDPPGYLNGPLTPPRRGAPAHATQYATRRPRRMRCEREAARPKRRCGLGSKGGKDPPRNLIRVDPSGKGGVTQPAMRPERTTKDAPPSSLQGILEKPEGVYDPLPGALQISSPQRRPPSFVSPARRASEPIVPPAARR
jgi:hypothetical protein